MSTQTSPPLDELQHRRPDIINWWVSDMGGSPMDENMIHRYLAESPFFDHSTKNGLHFLHAQTNMAEFELVKDRRRFEEDLKRHVGSEYLIVGEPQLLASGEKSGVWVLRKQLRQRTRAVDGRVEEEVVTLGTYYIVGENMYQAPSVGDVVGSRLLSATSHLSKFFHTARGLPSFSPTTGYTYLPTPHTTSTTTTGGTNGGGAVSTPSHSREGSVLPTADIRSTSLTAPDAQPSNTSTSTSTLSNTNAQDTRLLTQSFKHTLEFANEYTDENPLLGEPGHFSFTSSLAAVKKRKAADEEAAALAAKAAKAKLESTGTGGGGGDDSVVKKEVDVDAGKGGPPAVMTEAKSVLAVKEREKEREKERRGSKLGERVRRKKSRVNVGSLAGAGEGAARG